MSETIILIDDYSQIEGRIIDFLVYGGIPDPVVINIPLERVEPKFELPPCREPDEFRRTDRKWQDRSKYKPGGGRR